MYNDIEVAKMQPKGDEKMINTSKLRGRIVEKGKTIQAIAPKIPCTPYVLGQKIANERPMKIEEATILANELDIGDNEIVEYFFYDRSCINATK
jgi:hypothetical protein|uniref:Uncharacterized protein n=1 Tax=Siphoviridae sp. ct1yA16 TaxID=2827767 RepID=A0A8S5TEM9_9CAUD|nr:MAG TPA: Protein of unknown function (DUF739) [Siphoviridae sp. ct1yA16]